MGTTAAQTFLWWDAAEWSAIGVWFSGAVTIGLIAVALRQLGIANRQVSASNEQSTIAAEQLERATAMNAENLAAQQRLADEQSRPYVVAELTSRGDEGGILQVTNVGATPAYDVRLALGEKWVPAADADALWQYSQAFKSGLPLMAPGQNLRYFLDLLDERHDRPDLSMAINLDVRYRSSGGNEFHETQTIDLEVHMLALMHDRGIQRRPRRRTPDEACARMEGEPSGQVRHREQALGYRRANRIQLAETVPPDSFMACGAAPARAAPHQTTTC